MSMNGPLRTPFESPLVGTPSPGESTMRGEGVTLSDHGGSGQGLTGTPFEHPIVPPPGSAASGNSSEIPADWLTVKGIPDAPAPGSTAAVADGVATPNTPGGNMAGGKDGENIGIGKS